MRLGKSRKDRSAPREWNERMKNTSGNIEKTEDKCLFRSNKEKQQEEIAREAAEKIVQHIETFRGRKSYDALGIDEVREVAEIHILSAIQRAKAQQDSGSLTEQQPDLGSARVASTHSKSSEQTGLPTPTELIAFIDAAVCPECDGSGQTSFPLGEHFVTREMAIDAGDRSMEGQSMGIEYGHNECQWCHFRNQLRAVEKLERAKAQQDSGSLTEQQPDLGSARVASTHSEPSEQTIQQTPTYYGILTFQSKLFTLSAIISGIVSIVIAISLAGCCLPGVDCSELHPQHWKSTGVKP
jgi:hypothetical protein